jgi:hypothetical protein
MNLIVVGFGVFMAVTEGFLGRFEGTYCLHGEGRRVSHASSRRLFDSSSNTSDLRSEVAQFVSRPDHQQSCLIFRRFT